MTLEDLAAWLNEEYRRMAARPDVKGQDALVRSGYMAALAEIECIVKSGELPRHCPCREDWLIIAEKRATEDARALSNGLLGKRP